MLILFVSPIISMAHDTTVPQDGPFPPPFARSNTSSTSLYFDAMPSMSSIFNKPRGQSRSSSPDRGFKPFISAPIPADPRRTQRPSLINGNTNIGEGEDDKTTLKASGSTHGDGVLASESPQQLSPVKTEGRGRDKPTVWKRLRLRSCPLLPLPARGRCLVRRTMGAPPTRRASALSRSVYEYDS
jgi:hypothetical protein